MTTLTQIREGRGHRLEDVRRATGIHVSTVSRIERGQLPRTPGFAERLASFYGLELGQFYAAISEGRAEASPSGGRAA
jgi:transcriptional regulator with XRE-family HTH domain